MPKPATKSARVDCWESKLDPEQRDRIYDRLLARFIPSEVSAWIAAEYSLPEPSRAALYNFRSRWKPEYEQRRSEQILLASESTKQILEKVGNLDETVIRQAQILATDAAVRQDFEASRKWLEVIESVAKRNYDTNKQQMDKSRLERLLSAERERDELKSEIVNLKSQIADTKAALIKAGQSNVADPKAVADEVDKLLGRKPR